MLGGCLHTGIPPRLNHAWGGQRSPSRSPLGLMRQGPSPYRRCLWVQQGPPETEAGQGETRGQTYQEGVGDDTQAAPLVWGEGGRLPRVPLPPPSRDACTGGLQHCPSAAVWKGRKGFPASGLPLGSSVLGRGQGAAHAFLPSSQAAKPALLAPPKTSTAWSSHWITLP